MFDEKLYSPSQLNAIKSTDRNMMILAGPGSGKTHTMTGRILYLTEVMNILPSQILVITFTKDAAISMQKRFSSLSQKSFGVVFGTFHSVFYHMICDYKKNFAPSLFFENAKIRIASSIASDYESDDISKKVLAEKILSSVSIYKNTLNEEMASIILPDKQRSSFIDIFSHFENIRKKKNLLDFDDMVYDCLNMLKNDSSFRNKWSKRFRYILIDEFQDINPVQYETVINLITDDSSVFAVGDDDQSIYGFRGSDPLCIRNFIKKMNAGIFYLNENYRSTDLLVNSSLLVINENKNRIKKDLFSKRIGIKEDLVIRSFADRESEIKAVIKDDNDKKIKRAVLFRTNLDMQYYASYFSAKNIPFQIREKTQNIYDHFIMKDIFSYLGAAYLNDTDMLKNIINRPFRNISSETLIKGSAALNEMIRYAEKSEGIIKSDTVKNLKTLKKDLEFMKSLTPCHATEYLYNKIGYKKYVMNLSKKQSVLSEEYSKILSKAKEMVKLSDDYEELLMLKSEYEDDLKRSKNNDQENESLNLMTLHASKGLEFDKVYIPDCNEGIFPCGKMPDEETVEEERRLFYVGMTRAVKSLHLYYVSGNGSGKNMRSRFLSPLLNSTN